MLIELLHERAQRHPDRPAVIFGGERLSYGDLHRSALALAGRLRAAGVEEGDFVCLLLPNNPGFVIAFFAIAAVGGVAVPLDTGLTRGEHSRYVDGLSPAVVVTEPRFRERVAEGCPVVLVEARDDFPRLTSSSSHEGPVLCQCSSGSTGFPKRVVRTQRHLIGEYRQLAGAVEPREDDVVLGLVPLHHAHGFGNAMLFAICNGLRLVIPDPPRGSDGCEVPLPFWRGDLLELLATERVTVMPAVPFVFDILAEVANSPDNLHLRLCISAGSPLSRDTYRRFRDRFDVPIRQLYGCTEAGSVTLNTDEDVDATWQSVGTPLPGVGLRLVGDDDVIAFRSRALADGYHGRPAGGDEAFRDGWFHTGDIGRLDEEGRLYVLGRRRPLIVSGGFKIDPREVEKVLCAHPKVAEAVAFGVPDPVVNQIVKAVVVPRDGASLDEEELSSLCNKNLASHKRPRLLDVRDSLPRSSLGKVLVGELI